MSFYTKVFPFKTFQAKQAKLSSLPKESVSASTVQVEKENKTNNVFTETSVEPPTTASITKKKTSALKLWLEDNKKLVIEKYPDASETELLVKAAHIFKDVDDSVKQVIFLWRLSMVEEKCIAIM